MFEMWIIIIALISWCMLHLNNQRSIIIYAPFNVVKILLAVVVSVALLVFFWNTDINNDIRITLIASLLVVISMLKEGISQNKVVKLGLLSESLQNIESIEIEEETVGEETVSVLKSKATDTPGYFGFGCIVPKVKNKARKYRAIFFTKVQFGEPNETAETKGENIAWQTPAIEGKVMRRIDGTWKEEITVDSLSTAKTWLKEKVNIA